MPMHPNKAIDKDIIKAFLILQCWYTGLPMEKAKSPVMPSKYELI